MMNLSLVMGNESELMPNRLIALVDCSPRISGVEAQLFVDGHSYTLIRDLKRGSATSVSNADARYKYVGDVHRAILNSGPLKYDIGEVGK